MSPEAYRRKGLFRSNSHKAVEGYPGTSGRCDKARKAGTAWRGVSPSHPEVLPRQASTRRPAVAGPCLEEYQATFPFAESLPASEKVRYKRVRGLG